jgi:heptose-I-phosphate ethanolaminephosphotransferase
MRGIHSQAYPRMLAFFVQALLFLILPGLLGLVLKNPSLDFRDFRLLVGVSALLSLVEILPWNRWGRIVPSLVLGLIAVASLLSAGHLLVFSSGFNEGAFLALMDMSSRETREFMETHGSLKNFFILFSFPAFVVVLGQKSSKWLPLDRLQPRPAGVYLAVFLSLALLWPWSPRALFQTPPLNLMVFGKQFVDLQNYMIQRPFRPPQLTKTPAKIPNELIVIVLGESTARRHLGLYGYSRPTTPLLSARSDLLAFKKILSARSHTVPALRIALTRETLKEPINQIKDNFSVIELARAAGFETQWISNQPVTDWFGIRFSHLFRTADKKILLNSGGPPEYDEIVLPYLDQSLALESPRKQLIVIHLMGAHIRYRDRYPPSFSNFSGDPPKTFASKKSDRQLINEYDNAVLYQDSMLSQILARVEKTGRPASLVYFSDHGQDVFDTQNFFGHTEARASPAMFEIPFFVWISKQHPRSEKLRNSAKQNLNKLYSTEDFLHSAHDLMGVETSFYSADKSILNPAFKSRRYQTSKFDYYKATGEKEPP